MLIKNLIITNVRYQICISSFRLFFDVVNKLKELGIVIDIKEAYTIFEMRYIVFTPKNTNNLFSYQLLSSRKLFVERDENSLMAYKNSLIVYSADFLKADINKLKSFGFIFEAKSDGYQKLLQEI